MYKWPFALVAVALIILGVFLFREDTAPAATYTNETYGFSFSYPEGYVLKEEELGGPEHEHYVVTLMRDADATPREGGEGPSGVTIEIYRRGPDLHTLTQWISTYSMYSNFKLGDGTYASTTVDGTEAVRYHWSGLYEGETTALIEKEIWMVLITVTRLSPEDHTEAYKKVLRTFMFHE